MSSHFTQNIDAACFRPTESEVTLGLADLSGGAYRSFSSTVTGPKCRYSRTLPATFQVPPCVCQADASQMTQAMIPDPCYWTPKLPFLYDCSLDIKYSNGNTEAASQTLGLKRWEIDGDSFFLERKRFVLRGIVATDESEVDMQKAHEAELAVMVPSPSEVFLQEASERGVMVIADTRNCDDELTRLLLGFSWQPAVAIVVPPPNASYVPHSQILSTILSASNDAAHNLRASDWAKAAIVELETGQKPPVEMQKLGKPVIAIRRGVEYADLTAARAACDRLQAELAPDFDLAGYFVAP